MRRILSFLAAIFCFACSETGEIEPQYNLDVMFELSVFSTQDEDLLNPATINYYDAERIKLFYEIDGEMVEVYNPNLDCPRNFFVFEHENIYRMQITLNHADTCGKQITYIKWDETDIDTLEALFIKTERSVQKRQVWLNNTQIWEWSTNEDEYYRMKK